MRLTSRCCVLSVVSLVAVHALTSAAVAWDESSRSTATSLVGSVPPSYEAYTNGDDGRSPLANKPQAGSLNDFQVKVAYGRTVGTSTALDYATVEVAKPVSKFGTLPLSWLSSAEVQLAVLASYVLYYEGNTERIKRLDFRDGYEVAWLPKSKLKLQSLPLGMVPYLESGAGMSYVSETYRNSGSRWNWSLLGGFGMERTLPGTATISLGVQWRHLSNGNMWGKGDELHNSNSGTDMVQGMAAFLHRF